MKENLYLTQDLAIINYNAAYPRTEIELLNSADFANVLRYFIDYTKEHMEDLYYYILNGKTEREATFEMIKFVKTDDCAGTG